MIEEQGIPTTKVHEFLDEVEAGHRLWVSRTNGSLYSSVGGPALVDPSLSRAVAIDLLDGAPVIVRTDDGQVYGTFDSMEVYSDEGVALFISSDKPVIKKYL